MNFSVGNDNHITTISSNPDGIKITSNSTLTIVFGIVLLFAGLGLWGKAFLGYKKYEKAHKDYVKIEAVVIGYDTDEKGQKAEIVEYEVNGKKYNVTSPNYFSDPDELGEKETIIYNSKNPSEAEFDSIHADLIEILGGIVCFIGGIIFTIIGFSKRKKAKRPNRTMRTGNWSWPTANLSKSCSF